MKLTTKEANELIIVMKDELNTKDCIGYLESCEFNVFGKMVYLEEVVRMREFWNEIPSMIGKFKVVDYDGCYLGITLVLDFNENDCLEEIDYYD